MRSEMKIEKKNRFKTLILENCLIYGQHSKFTNKKITKYLLGTRKELELFRTKELEHILLKIYPFIHTIFTPTLVEENLKFRASKWWQEKKRLKIPFHKAKKSNMEFNLLFATTNALYQNITKSAAAVCRMSTTKNESGFSDVNFFSLEREADSTRPSFTARTNTTTLQETFKKKYSKNKLKNSADNQLHKKPSLVVIPDVTQSINLIKEMNNNGTPIIGLIDSNTIHQIDYPIMGNASSIHVVHFFCHLLAKLIVKAANHTQRAQVLPNFFIKSKNNIKQRARPKRHSFFYASAQEYWKKKARVLSKRSKKNSFNYTRTAWGMRVFNRFKKLKVTKFLSKNQKLKFLEAHHDQIRIISKLLKQLTNQQFLKYFPKWSEILRLTYFSSFKFQSSRLIKNYQKLNAEKNYSLAKPFSLVHYRYLEKRSETRRGLWKTWWKEQWREQTYAGINNKYYWRVPRTYNESHQLFSARWIHKRLEETPTFIRNLKAYRRLHPFKWKRKRKKSVNMSPLRLPVQELSPNISQKIRKLQSKNKIKERAERIKNWMSIKAKQDSHTRPHKLTNKPWINTKFT